MQRVAVIGAGLSGLSVCSFLLMQERPLEITLFDSEGVAGGASKVAAGLLHPYPGEKGRRSLEADLALAKVHELLSLAEGYSKEPLFVEGVIRYSKEKELARFDDIQSLPSEGAFFRFAITSGRTVFVPRYLRALWAFCEERGAKLVREKVEDTRELDQFDQVVIAAGAGIRDLEEGRDLPLKWIKGQVLSASGTSDSLIGKGYVARAPDANRIHLGSTYEHHFSDASPCMKTAKEIIIPRLCSFLPWAKDLQILDCQAGIRVANKNHYFPIAKQIGAKKWVVTAMGSRGLLYHALLGERVAKKIAHSL